MKPEIINISLFPYFGNKDNEMEEIYANLPDMNSVSVIIEPFCGSFALTRYLLLHYPYKSFICNDNDEMLIKTYKALQYDDTLSELLEFFKTFEVRDKKHYDEFKKENSIRSFLFTHMIYKIRPGLYDRNKNKFNEKDLNKLIHFNKNYKYILFKHGDAQDIIENYKYYNNVFMFLDPPFLLTSNLYNKGAMSEFYFIFLKDVNNIKAPILGVCGDHLLTLTFYEYYNIKIKFKTKINYLGNKSKSHENIYVSNY